MDLEDKLLYYYNNIIIYMKYDILLSFFAISLIIRFFVFLYFVFCKNAIFEALPQ